jgi:hypothetical protein
LELQYQLHNDMGIFSRDYMKRPPNDGDERPATADGKLESFLSDFLQRHPRFFIYLGVVLAVLIIAGLLVAKFGGKAP